MNFQSHSATLSDLDARARAVFKSIVESYLDTGAPVGSRTLARQTATELGISAASIRNTMADLASMGLLASPHISAGRMPTHAGLRLFVDGLMEVGDLSPPVRQTITGSISTNTSRQDEIFENASNALAELAGGAGLVLAPSNQGPLRHVEFVGLDGGQGLVVLVYEDGHIENRLLELPPGLVPAALERAGNFLSNRLKGRKLAQARTDILQEIETGRSALDAAAAALVKQGIASWSGNEKNAEMRNLIVRGRAQLLDKSDVQTDLERIQLLFEDLERKQELISLLDLAEQAGAVKIFIGKENPMFSLSGSSVVVAPYRDKDRNIIGALGVIGPTRLNYARVIPMVDYTAEVIGKLLSQEK
ncbi:MAG TPA: heat-inducible transcriptional repressor HrcA [Hellea balneolensis]|uniref:Heat-inducible transcription repressor HrcA n=1 Tax=Hellea balneolensis TaxID=287478 RepID=A0A7C5LTN7_9PROT|nr:heat-inducible transcriptional repressor HrcA [Hellea balneolensis]